MTMPNHGSKAAPDSPFFGRAIREFAATPARYLLRRNPWQICALVALSILLSLLSLMPAFSFGYAIDSVLRQHSTEKLVAILAILGGGLVLEILVSYADTSISEKTRSDALLGLQKDLIGAYSQLEYQDLEEKTPEMLYDRVASVSNAVTHHISRFQNGATLPIFFTVSFFVLFYDSPILGTVIGALTIFYFLVFDRISKKIKMLLKVESVAADKSRNILYETLTGISTIKMFSSAANFAERWATAHRDWLDQIKNREFLSEHAGRATLIYQRASLIIILGIGSYLVFGGALSVGKLVVANMVFRQILIRTRSVVPFIQKQQSTKHSLELVIDSLNCALSAQTVFCENASTATIKEHETFSRYDENANVFVGLSAASYKPPKSSLATLKNISLSVLEGEILVVIGASGSGKTTLLKLLGGVYQPSIGKRFGSHSGSSVLVTPNDPFFGISMLDNVSMLSKDGNQNALKSIHAVGMSDHLLSKEAGMNTKVLHNGSNLSYGQRHRLAIARGISTQDRLVLLDEPTGALDSETEEALIQNIHRLKDHKTLIIATHRLGPSLIADQIVILKNGEIIESGYRTKLESDVNSEFRRWVGQCRAELAHH